MNNLWEKLYQDQQEKAMMQFPFSIVIELFNFYQNKYTDIEAGEINVLEVGCGSGANLKYAAGIGYNVFGIDISNTAVEYAKSSFKKSGLEGEFIVCSAVNLPFDNDFFHIIIDHGSLICLPEENYKKAIDEIHRVAKKGSVSLLTPYSDNNYNSIRLFCGEDNAGIASFKDNHIYINSLSLDSVIKVLNNRFKVVMMRRYDRTDYRLSEDNRYVLGGGIKSSYTLFVEKV